MHNTKTPENDLKLRTSSKNYSSQLKYINTVSTKMSTEEFSPLPKKNQLKNERCIKLTKKQKMLITLKGNYFIIK